MAKRSSGSARANRTAQQLGRLLGQVAARVDSWKQQRDALRSDLASIVDTANRLMDDLGGAAATGRKAGRQAGKAVGKARRDVSAVARARMAAAARRRWQRYRAEKSKAGK
jgi:ElaB/YqjD/DUF883 family membrane-anchored ribosome-binding protein